MPLGLPETVRGFLFDMDGVLTRTASVHEAAWKQTFDEFLRSRDGDTFEPFGHDDYERYVDGRSREDGTKIFLRSRGLTLPGAIIRRLSDRKNELLLAKLSQGGVEVFDDAVQYVKAVAAAGYPRAVVSASANTAQVLESAGIAELFDGRVDGVVARERGLAGKPAPDMFLAGSELLGLTAARAAVFEDALAGVEAGRAGRFGCVVGVDRVGQSAELKAHGADLVVTDLTSLLRDGTQPG